MLSRLLVITVGLAVLGVAPAARAQWAVVDVGAIAQLVQQVETLKQQVDTARNQLAQAQTEYQSMTGGRGMELLLSGTVRNYLPTDWGALSAVLNQTSALYGALSRSLNTQVTTNAVLTPQQIAALSPAERDQVQAARQSAALLQVTTQEALSNTSARFNSLQQLISAIGTAQDQKAALDLQARISAETNMLQNEHTKLEVLYQMTQAQELARRQRNREQAIVDIGSVRNLPPVGLLN